MPKSENAPKSEAPNESAKSEGTEVQVRLPEMKPAGDGHRRYVAGMPGGQLVVEEGIFQPGATFKAGPRTLEIARHKLCRPGSQKHGQPVRPEHEIAVGSGPIPGDDGSDGDGATPAAS